MSALDEKWILITDEVPNHKLVREWANEGQKTYEEVLAVVKFMESKGGGLVKFGWREGLKFFVVYFALMFSISLAWFFIENIIKQFFPEYKC